MATVCYPSSGQVTSAFAGVAKYYGVGVDVCPSRRGNRKGVVEKVNHSAAQRWWPTLPDDLSVEQAQSGVDKLAVRMDARRPTLEGARTSVAELASSESLLALPALPFPAELSVERTVTAQSLVPFEGKLYSIPPGLPGARVTVTNRLGEDFLSIATAWRAVIARHRKAVRGSGQTVRDAGHVIALERLVLASFSDRAPCKSKVRRPPSETAQAEAARLREGQATGSSGLQCGVGVAGLPDHVLGGLRPQPRAFSLVQVCLRSSYSRGTPRSTPPGHPVRSLADVRSLKRSAAAWPASGTSFTRTASFTPGNVTGGTDTDADIRGSVHVRAVWRSDSSRA
ncbi:Mu transposase domain-containing protein [Streptomyces sp. NPDC001774]